ncbi:hypothetical protein CBL_21421, partial [Carabus blaptoides fortunei]
FSGHKIGCLESKDAGTGGWCCVAQSERVFPDKPGSGNGECVDGSDGPLPLESLWAAGLDGGMGLEQLYRRRCVHNTYSTADDDRDLTNSRVELLIGPSNLARCVRHTYAHVHCRRHRQIPLGEHWQLDYKLGEVPSRDGALVVVGGSATGSVSGMVLFRYPKLSTRQHFLVPGGPLQVYSIQELSTMFMVNTLGICQTLTQRFFIFIWQLIIRNLIPSIVRTAVHRTANGEEWQKGNNSQQRTPYSSTQVLAEDSMHIQYGAFVMDSPEDGFTS